MIIALANLMSCYLPLVTAGAINLEKALVLFLEYTTSNFAKIRFPALEAA